jgi:hypothetical protein
MDQLIEKKPLTDKLPQGGKINQGGGRRKTRRKRKRKRRKSSRKKRRTKRKGGDLTSIAKRLGDSKIKFQIKLKEREIAKLKARYRKLDPKTNHASRDDINKKAKKIKQEIDLLKDPTLATKEAYGKRRRGLSASELMPDARVLQREDRTKKWHDIKTTVNKALETTSNELRNHTGLLNRIQNKLRIMGEKQDFKAFNDFLEAQKQEDVFKNEKKTDQNGKTPIQIIDGLIDHSYDTRDPQTGGDCGSEHLLGGRRKKRKKTRRKKRTKKKARRNRRKSRKR